MRDRPAEQMLQVLYERQQTIGDKLGVHRIIRNRMTTSLVSDVLADLYRP